MLKFSYSNSKIHVLAKFLHLPMKAVVSFDLPAGFSCPKADICRTYADKNTGRLTRVGRIKCYASKAESYSPQARWLRWHNFDTLLACGDSVDKLATELNTSLPKDVKIVRVHSSGDLYQKEYFNAWREVAHTNPNIIFFGYTKEIEYAIADKSDNFYLQYSFGSKDDVYWNKSIPTCFINEYDNQYPDYKIVCGSKELGHEDYFSILNKESFVIGKH